MTPSRLITAGRREYVIFGDESNFPWTEMMRAKFSVCVPG